ncbi:MAG: S24 family peptidase [Ruminococcus sp.]|nr:S24 family peptidase [Ruminococcus sp.]
MFQGKENAISAEHLKNGEECIIVGFGQSMTPILKSGQPVRVVPITDDIILNKNDIVFAKVNGHFYLHKISAIKNNNTYQISNNHGHINGWVSKSQIFGKVVEIL